MATILIADDHALFRRGLKLTLLEMPGKIIVHEASNGQEVLKKIWENEYNAVLLDIEMPGRNGIDILKQVRNLKPGLPVLMLSMYPEEQYAIRALKAGAAGYLTKACGSGELCTAVQEVLRGGKYISISLASKLACYIETNDNKAPHETLSDREYEVMCMTGAGKSAKQIAVELSLSDKTISTYRARILNKMNMDNIAQLIQYLVKKDLLY